MLSRRGYTFAALLWLAFVVYGSLIPFAYAPQSFNVAWESFLKLPWLAIGAEGRADWLANLFLYAPLAYLWMGALDARGTFGYTLASTALVIGALSALAIAVEFLQLYFPPRTVSLNDVFAEVVGAASGAALWPLTRTRSHGMRRHLSLGGRPAMRAMVSVYAAAYLGLALFPMDFVLDRDEFAQKLAGVQVSWWLVPGAFSDPLRGVAQLLGEAVLVMPLGVAVAAASPGLRWPLAAVAMLVGPGIEIAQLFLASGVSQGASVVAKVAGVLLGAWSAFRIRPISESLRRWRHRRGVTATLIVAYLAVVVQLLGAFRGIRIPVSEAVERLATIPLLPLYNYYYTSETHAMVSVLAQLALFAPVGFLFGLNADATRRAAMLRAGFANGTIALAVQLIRLFHPPQRPDLTDVLIAIVAGVAACRLARFVRQSVLTHAGQSPNVTLLADREQAEVRRAPPAPGRSDQPVRSAVGRGIVAAVLVSFLFWHVYDYPLSRAALLGGLTCYAIALLRWPYAWLVVLPAALPILDFAAYSGRFFWTEFDALATVTLLVACRRSGTSTDAVAAGFVPGGLALILVLSIGIGLFRGLVPLEALDANAFSNYFSHYNALRVGKGAAWAVLFVWLCRREAIPTRVRDKLVVGGLVLGVACTVLVVLWERFAFSGLLDFADEYRVTGPFWEMNTGGAAIEGYLIAVLPFVVYLFVSARSPTLRVGSVAIFGAVVYSVLVTLSRNGIAALAASLLVQTVGLAVHFGRGRGKRFIGLIASVGIFGVAGGLAFPVLNGAALHARMANVSRDYDARVNHWSEALRIREPGWTAELFGMGLGRFPEAFYWAGGGNRSSTYRFVDANGGRFLRLGGGEPLYFEQVVAVEPETRYELVVFARSSIANGRLAIPICEKWLLTSRNCRWNDLVLARSSDTFERYAIAIDSGALAGGSQGARRPVRLSIYNPVSNAVADVANVQLISPDGTDLVYNGTFARGIDGWYFSTDDHLPWHIKNLAVQVLFDQGWFGILAWGAMLLAAMSRVVSGTARGELLSVAVLASIVGFIVIGIFDSLIDGPRMLLLFGLLLWLAFGPDAYRGSHAGGTFR